LKHITERICAANTDGAAEPEGVDVVANSPPGLLPNPVLALVETFAAALAAALSVLPMGKLLFKM